MSRLSRCLLGLVVLLGLSHAAAAQQPVTLDLRDGQVSLKAQNVPLRTILNEWARIGGTSIIGADRIPAGPVTIELVDVPERQALETLLRGVSGYLLGMRPAGAPGASVFNRILVMPTSVAPRALPAQAPPNGFIPTARPPQVPQIPQQGVQDLDDGPDPVDGQPSAVPGRPVRMPIVSGQNVPVPALTPAPAALPVPDTSAPTSAQPAPTVVTSPGNPFGVPTGSSGRPGVVTPVPSQTPQNQR